MRGFWHAMRQKNIAKYPISVKLITYDEFILFLYVTYVLTYFSTLSMIKQVGEHNSQKYRQQIDILNSLQAAVYLVTSLIGVIYSD